jgi:hypothetical protein
MKILAILLLSLLPLLAEVGKIVYIKGDVSLMRNGQPKVSVVGMALEEKDVLSTKQDALVKLLFADRSAVSIGSKSEFSIENYLFDEKKNSTAEFKMKKGVFRIITGKIAKISPEKFKFKTKTVTIGIRGTIFSGVMENNKEEFFCEKGSIYVSSKGVSIDVSKGYKTLVVPGRAPIAAKPYTASDIQKIHTGTKGWKDKKCKK